MNWFLATTAEYLIKQKGFWLILVVTMKIKNCEEVRTGINFIEAIGETEGGDFAYIRFRQGKLTVRTASSKTENGFINEKNAKREYKVSLEDITNPQELKREYNSTENAVEELL